MLAISHVTGVRYPMRDQELKPQGKSKAGGKIAPSGQQRQAGSADISESTEGATARNTVEMKNMTENSNQVGVQAATQLRRAATEELFDPQEWESLLNAFDNETAAAATSTVRQAEHEIELSEDDLWERLSSTRWLRAKNEDTDSASTVAQRPSA